jgi:hypothetical protein
VMLPGWQGRRPAAAVRWDSNPSSESSICPGRRDEDALTWRFSLPAVPLGPPGTRGSRCMRTQRGPLAFRSRTSPAFQSCATRDRIGRSGTARLSCACDLPRRWSLRALLGGSVVGQVDDSPPVILEPDRALAQGEPLHRGGVAAGRRGRPRGHLGRSGRAGGQLPDRDAWLPDRSRR